MQGWPTYRREWARRWPHGQKPHCYSVRSPWQGTRIPLRAALPGDAWGDGDRDVRRSRHLPLDRAGDLGRGAGPVPGALAARDGRLHERRDGDLDALSAPWVEKL